MPISPIVLQRRHAELGRIRLGDQVPAGAFEPKRGGGAKKSTTTTPDTDTKKVA